MRREGQYDIAVIGAGIAGASVAAHLAANARVALLEMERQPGYHTTGRSAAVFAPSYGPAPVRALTRASAAFFEDDPNGFAPHPLLTPRGALFVAREDQIAALDAAAEELSAQGNLERLDAGAARFLEPLLREDYVSGGLFDPDCSDIDVSALHHGYLSLFRAKGGALLTGAEVKGISRKASAWHLATASGEVVAPVVVNAAGAWAGEIGKLAGAEDIGLVPKRRTALVIAAPENDGSGVHPLVVDIEEEFYLKPDAGRLLISPANEDPDAPSDVQPDEMDIAICVDRIERAFDLKVKRIENRWAGLRSFVPDKSPVAAYSDIVPDFFWLAGQGGYGIQTAPALAELAASLITKSTAPDRILAEGIDTAMLSVARL